MSESAPFIASVGCGGVGFVIVLCFFEDKRPVERPEEPMSPSAVRRSGSERPSWRATMSSSITLATSSKLGAKSTLDAPPRYLAMLFVMTYMWCVHSAAAACWCSCLLVDRACAVCLERQCCWFRIW